LHDLRGVSRAVQKHRRGAECRAFEAMPRPVTEASSPRTAKAAETTKARPAETWSAETWSAKAAETCSAKARSAKAAEAGAA
jgi:hypothetical protein